MNSIPKIKNFEANFISIAYQRYTYYGFLFCHGNVNKPKSLARHSIRSWQGSFPDAKKPRRREPHRNPPGGDTPPTSTIVRMIAET